MTGLLTKILIKILSIKPIKKLVWKIIAYRFVAGKEIEDALGETENLNKQGIAAIINYLGEKSATLEKIKEDINIYLHLVREISIRNLNARISVKPTQLGLSINEDLYFKNLLLIGTLCQQYNIPMEIDMEEFSEIEKTVKNSILVKSHLPNLHIRQCLQIAAKQSSEDIKKLTDAGVHIRLCKSAYKIPPSAKLLPVNYIPFRIVVYANCTFTKYVEVATHDMEIINMLKDGIGVQLLRGVLTKKIPSLQSSGHLVAIYVPFGPEWVPYGVRRLFYLIKNYKKIFE